MRRSQLGCLALVALLAIAGTAHGAPRPKTIGTIESSGRMSCWAASDPLSKTCEASAAVLIGPDQLVLANDDPITAAGRSQVWQTRLPRSGVKTPRQVEYTAPLFRSMKKIEGMAITPDRSRCFATGATIGPKSNPWADPILSWPTACPDRVHEVRYVVDGVAMDFGQAIEAAIRPGTPLSRVKVEGLAWLPGNRLAFGIRMIWLKTGERTYNEQFVAIVVTVRYRVNAKGHTELQGPVRKVLEWNPSQVTGKSKSGISSLAYDPARRRLMIVTAYEYTPPDLAANQGAFYWLIPVAKLGTGIRPRLVRNANGDPLHRGHKTETIVPLGCDRYLLISDDDGVLGNEVVPPTSGWPRKPHQAAYAYLRLR